MWVFLAFADVVMAMVIALRTPALSSGKNRDSVMAYSHRSRGVLSVLTFLAMAMTDSIDSQTEPPPNNQGYFILKEA